MIIAALYDIHGNLPALEAVLDEVRGVGAHHVVVGGDVLPGPMPAECLDLLAELDVPTTFISGNGEVAMLAERDGRDSGVPPQHRPAVQWVASQVTAEQARRLAHWPKTAVVDGVLFCHATPRSDTDIFVRTTPEDLLRPVFEAMEASTVVCGHTHMQFDRSIGPTRVVNAGSVGMPFGAPGAYWLLLGPQIQLRRTAYDLAAAAERIRATSYPGAAAFAARNVLEPPSEREMLTLYETAALRSGIRR